MTSVMVLWYYTTDHPDLSNDLYFKVVNANDYTLSKAENVPHDSSSTLFNSRKNCFKAGNRVKWIRYMQDRNQGTFLNEK